MALRSIMARAKSSPAPVAMASGTSDRPNIMATLAPLARPKARKLRQMSLIFPIGYSLRECKFHHDAKR